MACLSVILYPVMTPLVDVVAIDGSFHNLWLTHQYSRLPVFEQRIENIVWVIAYAMDRLDYVSKGQLLQSTTVADMAHKPAYFVPDPLELEKDAVFAGKEKENMTKGAGFDFMTA